jgi:hypothetical protein
MSYCRTAKRQESWCCCRTCERLMHHSVNVLLGLHWLVTVAILPSTFFSVTVNFSLYV